MQTATDLRIASDDLGDRDTALLFLTGWCSSRKVFRDLLPIAARDRRVLAPDWRGHGGSSRPEEDFTTEDLVADTIEVLDRAEVATVVPVGLAHAGWVAIELRRRLGAERVPGIVLCDWMVLGPPPPFLGALAGLQQPEAWQAVRSGLFAMWTEGVDLPALDRQIAEMATYDADMWGRAGREIAAQFATWGSPIEALAAFEPAV